MAARRDSRPEGFGGYIENKDELLPQLGEVLRLPRQGVPDGPFLRWPEGPHACILVESLAESLGNLERFLARAAQQLEPAGYLLVDMENLAAPRSLRLALEGRPSNMDPHGSLAEPERRIHGRRVLRAIEAAGLLIQDVLAVHSPEDAVGPDFVRTIFREGFLALSYVQDTPPARLWILARKLPVLAGSVLVGAGSREAQAATEQSLRAFLPDDWEILFSEGGTVLSEAEAWNRTLPLSSGELLWFLRAGTRVDQELFLGLRARTLLSPAAPGTDEEPSYAGDISGLMVSRLVACTAGPLPRCYEFLQTTYEAWLLHLETSTPPVYGVEGHYEHVEPALPSDLERFKQESRQLMEKWRALEKDESGFVSDDNPRCRHRRRKPAPWEGPPKRKPTISLCMIAKNEEDCLGRCLASAAPLVDEIILVDTGSSDRTIEIAREYGARVYYHEWQDDFSAARNAALKEATGDWILSLDADEVLVAGRVEEQAEELREAVEDPGVVAYHLEFNNLHTGVKTAGVMMVRLFRNLEGVTWVNRIHEQVTRSLEKVGAREGLILSLSHVTVDHYGYLDEVMESRGKDERNERIFRQHLEEQPDDIYMLYKYGDFLRRTTSRWEEARKNLQQAFDLISRMAPEQQAAVPYAGEIAALLALEYRRQGEAEGAEEVIQSALRRFVATPNLHYLAAGLALAGGRADEAIQHYERCLAFRDQVLVVPIQEGITSHVSITGIAQACMIKGEKVKARRLLEQSMQLEPEYEVTTLALSRLHFEEGDLQRSLTVLTDYLKVHPDAVGACQQAALILKQLGLHREAQEMGARAIQLLEEQALDFEARQLRNTLVALS